MKKKQPNKVEQEKQYIAN